MRDGRWFGEIFWNRSQFEVLDYVSPCPRVRLPDDGLVLQSTECVDREYRVVYGWPGERGGEGGA